MTEKKRRQGQIRKDGKTSTPKEICPKCGEYLKTAWMLENRKYKRVGLTCPNPTCDHMEKDFIEIEEEPEEEVTEGTDKVEKIKKLTEEFMKTHDKLNELAEQIKELETE